ncbi:hypothetical protein CEE86_14370, partial [Lactobacillus crispatus]
KPLAQQDQLHRHRKPVEDRFHDRHLGGGGAAEVALQKADQPVQETQHQRLIEAEFGAHLRDGRRRRLVAEQSERDIARQQVQEQESRRGDQQQHQDQAQQLVQEVVHHRRHLAARSHGHYFGSTHTPFSRTRPRRSGGMS